MPLLIWISCVVVAVAVLAGVAVVVLGRGGQLARFEADYPPFDTLVGTHGEQLSPRAVAALRLPLSLWGYHVRAVDEALAHLAEELRERDRRIAELEGGDDGGSPPRPGGPDAAPPAEVSPSGDGTGAEPSGEPVGGS